MAKVKYFAIAVGPMPGIYHDSWDNLRPVVEHIPKWSENTKSFKSYSEAEKWLQDRGCFDYCVERKLGEDSSEDKNTSSKKILSEHAMDVFDLPWDDPQDYAISSAQVETVNEGFGAVVPQLLSTPARVDYSALDSKFDSDKRTITNRIKEPDKSPILQKVRDFANANDFSQLSDDQLRAVQKETGKALLFAVPGSGKTTVIVARTGYLIYSCNVPPEKIMTLTFTRAAAEEMKSRYLKKFARRTEKGIPEFRTIHSFCYSIILKRLKGKIRIPAHTIDGSVTVTDDENPDESKKITIQKILYDVLIKNGVNKADASDERIQEKLLNYISSCKNKKLTESQQNCSVYLSKELCIQFKPMFDAYKEELNRYDCMDYDDMLQLSYDGLLKCKDVLEDIREDYTYWSVDEAQDNSLLQYDLMYLLAGERGNLFMVGDDDQSIYGFRGAEPGALLAYGRDSDVVSLVMDTNYRSDSLIVNTTRSFIEISENREKSKKMKAYSKDTGVIKVFPAVSPLLNQYAYILKAAKENIQENKGLQPKDWKSTAVLYRNNISGLPVMFLLKKHGIPFTASKSAGDLLRGKPISSILKIIEFACKPESYELFKKAMNSINVHVSPDKEPELKKIHKQNPHVAILDIIKQLTQDQEHLNKINTVQKILNGISSSTSVDAINIIIRSDMKIGQTGSMGDRERIYALLTICALYPNIPDFLQAVTEMRGKFHKESSIIEDEKEELAELEDTESLQQKEITANIILSTAHKAKGQEFDRVIIIDALEAPAISTPTNELERSDPEEERRLFYVAMTRAKHELDILSVETYYGTPETPSAFISEYSNICDSIAEKSVLQTVLPDLPVVSSCDITLPELKERTIYAVRKGFETGIFYTDAERRKAVDGFSRPEQRTCHSMQEALDFLYPGGIPPEMRILNTKSLSDILFASSSTFINKKVDLPAWLNIAIPHLVFVNELSQLSSFDSDRIRDSIGTLFRDEKETDYTGKAIPYALAYLPANMLKIWKPLWLMLHRHVLPHNAVILEAGPGPGTATIGLMSFYSMLAEDNPDIHFHLTYHTVERQPDFSDVFSAITTACIQSVPNNLHIDIASPKIEDAYVFMNSIDKPTYDIILESNMMNSGEGLTGDKMASWLHGVEMGLKSNGFLIQIEPGTSKDKSNLQRLAAALNPIAQSSDLGTNVVDISGFKLQADAEKQNFRSHKMEHWFNWLLIRRK